jgi:hypothetical protein
MLMTLSAAVWQRAGTYLGGRKTDAACAAEMDIMIGVMAAASVTAPAIPLRMG